MIHRVSAGLVLFVSFVMSVAVMSAAGPGLGVAPHPDAQVETLAPPLPAGTSANAGNQEETASLGELAAFLQQALPDGELGFGHCDELGCAQSVLVDAESYGFDAPTWGRSIRAQLPAGVHLMSAENTFIAYTGVQGFRGAMNPTAMAAYSRDREQRVMADPAGHGVDLAPGEFLKSVRAGPFAEETP